uniref:Uncharacterized protein n=1 Tax=Parascaris univalens TaxID=6257 RepID=A0A915BMA8_PARUN
MYVGWTFTMFYSDAFSFVRKMLRSASDDKVGHLSLVKPKIIWIQALSRYFYEPLYFFTPSHRNQFIITINTILPQHCLLISSVLHTKRYVWLDFLSVAFFSFNGFRFSQYP